MCAVHFPVEAPRKQVGNQGRYLVFPYSDKGLRVCISSFGQPGLSLEPSWRNLQKKVHIPDDGVKNPSLSR